ncbi:MAG: ACT domain-containing protein, partial [bacterium]
ERAYRAFRVNGPLPLHLVGIVAALAVPLAEAAVPIFSIATYDTDYLLVKETDVPRAREALIGAGHQVITLSNP